MVTGMIRGYPGKAIACSRYKPANFMEKTFQEKELQVLIKPEYTLIVFGFLKPACVHGNADAETNHTFTKVGLPVAPVAKFQRRV